MPPAPARLSTRLGCCQISPSFWVKARAVVSTGPPGGKGTMKRTGRVGQASAAWATRAAGSRLLAASAPPDRKSTRLNSSHLVISSAAFCLKKKIGVGLGLPTGDVGDGSGLGSGVGVGGSDWLVRPVGLGDPLGHPPGDAVRDGCRPQPVTK